MLAQNFKTAADLRISEAQREALVRLLGMLERGEIRHQLSESVSYEDDGPLCSFNMMEWSCGSVGCLGGWCDFLAERPFPVPVRDEPLYGLFFPDDEDIETITNYDYDAITTSQAATALRNYLTLGRANWADIIESA